LIQREVEGSLTEVGRSDIQ